MPPPYVKTVKDEILYEYAKLISRSALGAKGKSQYGFITDRFKALKSGEATISGTLREWKKEQELQNECVYCGEKNNLEADHLIPKSRGGTDMSDNMVSACKQCNTSKGNKGVFQWLGLKEKDNMHRLVAGKYLKELYELHEQKETINISIKSLNELCNKCSNVKTCIDWKSSNKLSCLCLESIF